MGGTFLNYRRHDKRIAFVRALHGRLAERFGNGNVFLDSASIGHGRRYPNQLRRHLDRSDVVVVVIHPGWARELRTDGTDWVHNEIRWALDAGKTIIPLLMEGTAMPRAHELPRTIRELAHFQAHRATDDPGHDGLVEKIDAEPRRRAAVAETPPRPWAGPVAGVLGAVAFAVPVLLMPREWRELAAYLAVFGIVVLIAVMIAIVCASLVRKPLNTVEQVAHDLDPTRYFLLVALPLLIVIIGSPAALAVGTPIPRMARPLLVFCAAVASFQLVFLVLKAYKTEKFREDHWPVALQPPVKPAPVRRELERLLRKHTTADPQRVRWHLLHLENAADVLARDASRGRWRWLTSDWPGRLWLYAVWAAATVGLLTTAAQPALRFRVSAIALAVVVVIAGTTVETAFRWQRWARREVADEVQVRVQRIQDRSTQSQDLGRG
ncbi:toll/interleukin-1 receptor domain-containing protein [Nocardia sp. NRRL S-836]|uniref:toll/interleukin-1 receptor domain-containing protein n=1 Tax=Nocardia sp. NRRL S-836 TaxID=1519492 RepID=UPI0018D19AF4|nr:toll/interleukin-1 receptor domain-containing protein [Nocardia sp. NRRL S-836]